VKDVIYEWYLAWLDGHRLAEDANHALFALIPKSAEAADHTLGIYRRPKNLRPLSLSNIDVKILALSLNSVVAPFLPGWARPEQRGFIADRVIVQNVIDAETCAIEAALQTSLSAGPLSLSSPAAVFFDFGAAFPCLAQVFVWMLLAAIGVPPFVIVAIGKLYRDNRRFWRFKGPAGFSSRSARGSSRAAPSARPFLCSQWTRSLPHSPTPSASGAASASTPTTSPWSCGTLSARPRGSTGSSVSSPGLLRFVFGRTNVSSFRFGLRPYSELES
jgi:hypothetical protein